MCSLYILSPTCPGSLCWSFYSLVLFLLEIFKAWSYNNTSHESQIPHSSVTLVISNNTCYIILTCCHVYNLSLPLLLKWKKISFYYLERISKTFSEISEMTYLGRQSFVFFVVLMVKRRCYKTCELRKSCT